MQYLDYQEYLNIGGVLDAIAFNRHIMRVCGILRNETCNRIENMSSVPEAVKYCVRDMVEYLEANKTTDIYPTSQSQSAGGVSESQSYEAKTSDEIKGDIDNIMYDYLLSVKDECGNSLLYRGGGY